MELDCLASLSRVASTYVRPYYVQTFQVTQMLTCRHQVHVSAKYVFVRILRNSVHLQSNTFVHWFTWLGLTIGLSAVAFIIAAAIPIFNYLLGLAGSLGFAPIALILPPWLWLFDHGEWRTASTVKVLVYYMHCFWILIGVFMTIGGTYGIIQSVIGDYRSGTIGSAFDCADNSGSM